MWGTGLAGWWKLDYGSGTNAFDSSGNGVSGTLGGSPVWTTGHLGGALNTAAGYVTTGYTIPAQSSATSFTWSAWVNLASAGGTPVIMGFRNGATWAKLTPSAFEYGSGSIITQALPTNVWTLVTIVKNGSNFTYYENGAVVGTASNSSSVVSHTFYIGEDPGFGADGSVNGIIDDVRVYSRALSANEVANLYAQNATNPTVINGSASTLARGSTISSGLAGYWSFDGTDFNGTSVLDQSGNGNNGTNNNATKTIGKLGQALCSITRMLISVSQTLHHQINL